MRAGERKSGRIVIETRSRRILCMQRRGGDCGRCRHGRQYQTHWSQRDRSHLP